MLCYCQVSTYIDGLHIQHNLCTELYTHMYLLIIFLLTYAILR